MKAIFKLLVVIELCTLKFPAVAQVASSDYYPSIKSLDLSKLWLPGRIKFKDIIGEENTIDTEPIGFIGNNYQRFYIHYTSIVKDLSNPYRYIVKGKTRVKDNICFFSGMITIIKASLFNASDDPRYKEGTVKCTVNLKENNSQPGSGQILGTVTTHWCLDKKHNVNYDTINSEADGFENNQCEATWTSYQTHQNKKCNWGDFRIPASGDLDSGAGEFYVNKKYLNNGWTDYMKSMDKDKPGSKAASTEENRKWWE